MFFKSKKTFNFLCWGCIFSIALTFLELRYIFANMDFSQISPQPIILFIVQSILLTMIFWAVNFILNYIKKSFKKESAFKKMENFGLALQLISTFLFLSIFYFPYSIYLLIAISFVLFYFGLTIYRQTKNDISKSFLLWGPATLITLFLIASISTSSTSSWL